MSTRKSQYDELILESNDHKKTVDIRLGTFSIDYYEDIFSPTITAKIVVMDGGDSVVGKNDKLQSIYDGLPLRGGERLSMKIAGNSETNPGLDFSKDAKDYLYVSSISNVIKEAQREIFVLNLVSREAITNETSRVPGKFPTGFSIDSSVNKIITEYLKTDKIANIDKTSNTYGFIGNLRKPFSLLVWLASKAVPEQSDQAIAGFVFYQTRDGFEFRSLNNLTSQKPKATYTYIPINQSGFDRNNDFNILEYNIERNQNLLEKLRLGTYASYRTFYDPLTFKFTPPEQAVFKLENYVKSVKNLGQELEIPDGLGDAPSRILTRVLDIGTMEKGVSTKPNANPSLYQSQSIMRYNILFTQIVTMTVPSNTNLRAGDVIECKFPKITRGNDKEFDDDQSGLYMIKELCHHFDTEGSFTSMKLIRDTFGQYGTNNK